MEVSILTNLVNSTRGTWNSTMHSSNYTHMEEHEPIFFHVLYGYVAPILMSLIGLVGVVGNSMVIYVIAKNTRMHTDTNIMLLNLAVADIACLVLSLPFATYAMVHHSTWSLGDVVCKMVAYVMDMSLYVTVYILVALSGLRYLAIRFPLRSRNIRTVKTSLLLCILIWIIFILINIPVLTEHHVKTYVVAECDTNPSVEHILAHTLFTFGYIVPLCIMGLLYSLIAWQLSRVTVIIADTRDNRSNREREKKTRKVIFLVVVIFAIMWLPFHLLGYLSLYGAIPFDHAYHICYIISSCMTYGNSCINPIIYNFISLKFKTSFREILSPVSRRRPASSRTGSTNFTRLSRFTTQRQTVTDPYAKVEQRDSVKGNDSSRGGSSIQMEQVSTPILTNNNGRVNATEHEMK